MTSEPVSKLPDPKYTEALAESRQDAEFWARMDGIRGLEERRLEWHRAASTLKNRLSGRSKTEQFSPGSLAPEFMRRSEEIISEAIEISRDQADALHTALAQLDEARDRVDELERNAEVVSSEFEGDCWKAVRRLLDECNFDWRGIEDTEGVSAAIAEEHIKTTLDELERDATRFKARAEAAEARLEEQDASWRETLRIERDARLNENRLKMKATARLEDAKAVLGPFAHQAKEIPEGFSDDYPMANSGYAVLSAGHYRSARAFLHQGGSE